MKNISSLVARIEELRKKAAREKKKLTPDVPVSHDSVIRLPSWPDHIRAVPNGFLRSALFGAIGRGKRRFMKSEQIAALKGIEIRYTGERLDQGDLDVWENVLHAVRSQDLGKKCRLTSYALLKLMGKTDCGKNRATLQTRLERLRANAVTVESKDFSFIGGLVDEAYKDKETQEWVIAINPRLSALYAANQFTRVDWTIRQALYGHQLAQWLHGFYASHASPHPIRVETLLKLCGSENPDPYSSKQKLCKALDALIKVCKENGQLFSYSIHDDLVHVEKQPSESQQRHLTNKAVKARKKRV